MPHVTWLVANGHVVGGSIYRWWETDVEKAENYVAAMNNHQLKQDGITCRFDTDGTDRWIVFTDTKTGQEHIPNENPGINELLDKVPAYYMIEYDVPDGVKPSKEDLAAITRGRKNNDNV